MTGKTIGVGVVAVAANVVLVGVEVVVIVVLLVFVGEIEAVDGELSVALEGTNGVGGGVEGLANWLPTWLL